MKVLFDGSNQTVQNIVATCCEQAGFDMAENNEKDNASLIVKDCDENTDFTEFDEDKTLFLLPKAKFLEVSVKNKIAKPFLPMELIKFLSDFSSHKVRESLNAENLENLSSILSDIDELDNQFMTEIPLASEEKPQISVENLEEKIEENTKNLEQIPAQNNQNIDEINAVLDDINKLDDTNDKENADEIDIDKLMSEGMSLEEIAKILENGGKIGEKTQISDEGETSQEKANSDEIVSDTLAQISTQISQGENLEEVAKSQAIIEKDKSHDPVALVEKDKSNEPVALVGQKSEVEQDLVIKPDKSKEKELKYTPNEPIELVKLGDKYEKTEVKEESEIQKIARIENEINDEIKTKEPIILPQIQDDDEIEIPKEIKIIEMDVEKEIAKIKKVENFIDGNSDEKAEEVVIGAGLSDEIDIEPNLSLENTNDEILEKINIGEGLENENTAQIQEKSDEISLVELGDDTQKNSQNKANKDEQYPSLFEFVRGLDDNFAQNTDCNDEENLVETDEIYEEPTAKNTLYSHMSTDKIEEIEKFKHKLIKGGKEKIEKMIRKSEFADILADLEVEIIIK